MNNEPLKITGPAFFVKRKGQPGAHHERIWQTNRGPMTLAQLSEATGINRGALQSRIQKYGCDDAGLLDAAKKSNKPLRRDPNTIPIGTWERQMLKKTNHAVRMCK